MKITCEVIKDLIPLYVEGIASADSAVLVKDHIDSCEKCKIEVEKMGTLDKLPIDTNVLPLKRVRTALRKKKLLTIVVSIVISLTVAAIAIGYLTTPIYIPCSDDIVTVNEKADGTIFVKFGDGVSGYDINRYHAGDDSGRINDDSGFVYHITAWNSIWNRYIAKNKTEDIVLNPDGDKVASIYYYLTDGTEDVLIYGTNQNPNGGIVTLPRLVLSYYAAFAFVFAVICGVVLLIFRKSNKAKSIVMKVFLLPIAYLFAHICMKGFTSASYSATHDFFAILLVSLPLYIALLFCHQFIVSKSTTRIV